MMSPGKQAIPRRGRVALLVIVVGAAGVVVGGVYLALRGVRFGALVTARRTGAVASRPAAWAVPLDRPGLPNLHKVSDDLYRGAQPTAEGMRELGKMGVRTVVNLRSFHSDRDDLAGTDLRYEHIYMKAWHPEDEEVVRFLRIVADAERSPVFVHCQHGADRTGVLCAVYRIAVQGWSKEEAIREMTEGGFGHHAAWQNLVRYVRALDIDEIKRRCRR